MNVNMNRVVVKKGSRYFNMIGVIYVIVYSRSDVIKLMPLKKNAMIDVWDMEDFKKQVMLLKFTYIPHPPINRSNVSEHLLEFQFNIIGKTMSDTIVEPQWKTDWGLTDKQKILFKSYATNLLKKVFRFNTSKARETYEFFEKEFGLLTIN
jgi:hypothetical protein